MGLVAYGAQDIYLTGNPQITFFKVVYRRHTNFSMESIEQTFNGAADFGKRVTCTVSRNGDLMHRVYLQVTVPALTNTDPTDSTSPGWVDWLGHALIKNVEVEIGGQGRNRNLKVNAVHEVTVAGDSACYAFAKVRGTIESLFNGFHGEVSVAAVNDLEEGNLWVTSKVNVLGTVSDKLHQSSTHLVSH